MNNIPDADYAFYHPQGAANGTTVFLLHGAFGSKEYWHYQVGALVRAGYRVITWDAPGYGNSAMPDGFSIDLCAQTLARLLAQLGGERNVVLGHSMGGMIAQRAWLHCPERIHGYILSATGPAFGRPDGEWQQAFIRDRVAPLDQGQTVPQYAPGMLRAMMAPGASGAAVDMMIGNVARMTAETFRAAIQAITTFEGRAVLPTINVPVFCLAGELDATAPQESMRKMASKIPQAEFDAIAGAGHFAFVEQTDVFNQRILGFLDRHGYGRASESQ